MKNKNLTTDEYYQYLGLLKSNLFTLEFLLRVFLYNHALKASPKNFIQSESFENLKVGDLVSVNPITNYDTLGQLIKKYNQQVTTISDDLGVDRNLVDLRDILAHGRVSSREPSHPFSLLI